MPRDVFDADYVFLPHAELLTFEEIARIAQLFVARGVAKIRLTGGEPLLRRNLERLVEMLAKTGVADITLTTNGALLAKKARGLRDAGLTRVTVSLDSLDDATFRAMNDADFPVAKVLDGIDAAAAAGLVPIKINMVVKRGINDDGIVPMARHFRGTGHIVRYIEFMDVGATNGWRMDDVVPAADVVRMIDAEFPLARRDSDYAGEVAARWKYKDGRGEIGVIASVTQAFCRDCSRARLSTTAASPRASSRRRLRPPRSRARRRQRRGNRQCARRDLAPADRQLFGGAPPTPRGCRRSSVVHRGIARPHRTIADHIPDARPRPLSNSWRACDATTTAHGSSRSGPPTISFCSMSRRLRRSCFHVAHAMSVDAGAKRRWARSPRRRDSPGLFADPDALFAALFGATAEGQTGRDLSI